MLWQIHRIYEARYLGATWIPKIHPIFKIQAEGEAVRVVRFEHLCTF